MNTEYGIAHLGSVHVHVLRCPFSWWKPSVRSNYGPINTTGAFFLVSGAETTATVSLMPLLLRSAMERKRLEEVMAFLCIGG